MGVVYDDIDLSEELKANSSSPKFDPAHPLGNRNNNNSRFSKIEDFRTGTLASKSDFINLTYGTEDHSTLIDLNGRRVLRHCGPTEITAPDPRTGKARNGAATHTPRCDTLHSGAQDTACSLEMDFIIDDSWWKDSGGNNWPVTSGKMFISDATVDSLSWYTSLGHSGASIAVSSGNDGASNQTWSLATAGGWSSAAQNRPYKWVNSSGAASNYIYLQRNGHALFQSDGIARTFVIQVRYNPGGIGHNKVRLGVRPTLGAPIYFFKDNLGNTDANGWFPMAIEFKLKGNRFNMNNQDFGHASLGTPEDRTTHPGKYTGDVGGINILEYRFANEVYD